MFLKKNNPHGKETFRRGTFCSSAWQLPNTVLASILLWTTNSSPLDLSVTPNWSPWFLLSGPLQPFSKSGWEKMQMETFFCLKSSKTLHSLQSKSKVSTMSFLPSVIWLLHHLFFMANNSYHCTFSSTPMDLLILNAPNTQSLLGFALYSSSLWEILSRGYFWTTPSNLLRNGTSSVKLPPTSIAKLQKASPYPSEEPLPLFHFPLCTIWFVIILTVMIFVYSRIGM